MPSPPVRPNLDLVDLLLGEHGCILALIRHYERRLAGMSLKEMKECASALEAVLMSHAVEEDQLLFGTLPEARGSVRQALDAMYEEHQEQRRLLEQVSRTRELARARGLLARLLELTLEHFAVEERVLFGLARQVLAGDRLQTLGRDYARRRGIRVTR